MSAGDFEMNETVHFLICAALEEDIGSGDCTTQGLVAADASIRARILAKQVCVVSGTEIACATFRQVDPRLICKGVLSDGDTARPDQTILTIDGFAHGILTAERTALNFMQRLTGIATLTRRFVDAVAGSNTQILDTRKTTPGYRYLEKYAVRCGGGSNHRMGLYDRVMIKDNHRRLWSGGDPFSLDAAVRESRRKFPGIPVEVEVENEEELRSALAENPEWILLDNMAPQQMRACVDICAGRSLLEASGGITLDSVGEIAKTGVDAISLGCLTHSAPSADLSLEIEEVK